jgi:hypothetical protein
MPFDSSYCRNHKGATDFPDDIKNYLKKESSYKAIVGPFKSNPFNEPIAVLPINSVPKKESLERRVIVDLSFPEDKFQTINVILGTHEPNCRSSPHANVCSRS